MKGTITVVVQVDYNLAEGDRAALLNESRVSIQAPGLEVHDADLSPTSSGLRLATIALTTGLANNIHFGHQRNLWDSADHLRYIIRELEDQFVKVAEVAVGRYACKKGGTQ